MKKFLLPIAVIAASGAYVWTQQGQLTADTGFATTAFSTAPESAPAPAATAPAATAPAVAVESSTAPAEATVPATLQQRNDDDEDEDDIPLPVRRPTPALPGGIVEVATPAPARRPAPVQAQAQITVAAQNVSNGAFVDGTYNGPAANAYYGLVQVAAVIQNGQLTNVQILQYPSDRRTSRYINSQALPLLMREAIRAQSGNVDFISGATLTSNAFAKSLSAALSKARG